MQRKVQTIICGAGIAGVAAAYYLAVRYGQKDIILVDKLPPLSFTTSKSGENYRDFWPQPCMREFSTDSLNLMDELKSMHGDVFDMRPVGYQFVSTELDTEIFSESHSEQKSGISSCTSREEIRAFWPHLSDQTQQVVSINRAGMLDVYALGSLLLTQARAAGVELLESEIGDIRITGHGSYQVDLGDFQLEASQIVLASGPFMADMARQIGVSLPLENIAQRKFIMPDPLQVIPRDMPFTICADAMKLPWSENEAALIAGDPDYQWLLEEFPPGLHIKPESNDQIKLGWAFNRSSEAPLWDIGVDNDFPNLVVRGASRFIPGLSAYIDNLPTPIVQFAGYYTRTRENWPIIGPLGPSGAYAVGGLSGYGTMTGCAAGDLCARYIVAKSLPGYARNFHPDRYDDEQIVDEIDMLGSDGQL
ncbi:MAG: glycine/D-amino acid oxidase-like deaminating enzyme [Halieaceae bacterium]|jgi:glycine/D-amino acid oxidase-like deaminating enzyme